MKHLAIMLALGGFLGGIGLADELGGISGTVVDVRTGQPMPGVTLFYYRSPYNEHGYNRIMSLQTNSRGFFSDITLQPGRYIVMARFPNRVQGCAVDDVIGGENTHMKIELGHDQIMCSGPRVHPALVDPNATSDVYRM